MTTRRAHRFGRHDGLAFGGTVLALILHAPLARADPADPFWGPDKALHFVAAGTIAGVGYGLTTALTEDRWKAWVVGAGAAVVAGAVKEGLDAAGFGDPSWRDFAWDLIGAASGLGVAWLVDTAAHGGHPAPLTSSSAMLLPAGIRLRF
jgi:putative lipoprotein